VSRISGLAFASLFIGAELRAQQPPAPAPPPDLAKPASKDGLKWDVGDWTVKFGGYIKVDLIHDFDAIGSTDSFDPRTIPTDGTDGSNTRMHAKQTRLNLDLRGPTSSGPLRVFVEGDFFSSGNGFRMRHAYGVMDDFLVGQTWTNFMDEDMPETLDFESPIGFPQVRQAQVRYTNALADGNSFSVSIEDPASVIAVPTTTPGHQEEVLPDVTAKYYWKFDNGSHVQVSGFGGMSSFNPDSGSNDSVALWGFNLSTKLMTWAKDNAMVQLTYGDGVGRYRGGTTAAPDSDGNLEAIPTAGVLASYQHHWNEKYRSTVMYSWVEGDLPAGTPTTASERLSYFAANFIYQFSDHAWTGIEYLYGTNDTNDGNDGDASRIQMAVKFSF
jgi:hypothetical protein